MYAWRPAIASANEAQGTRLRALNYVGVGATCTVPSTMQLDPSRVYITQAPRGVSMAG